MIKIRNQSVWIWGSNFFFFPYFAEKVKEKEKKFWIWRTWIGLIVFLSSHSIHSLYSTGAILLKWCILLADDARWINWFLDLLLLDTWLSNSIRGSCNRNFRQITSQEGKKKERKRRAILEQEVHKAKLDSKTSNRSGYIRCKPSPATASKSENLLYQPDKV